MNRLSRGEFMSFLSTFLAWFRDKPDDDAPRVEPTLPTEFDAITEPPFPERNYTGQDSDR